MDFWKSFRHKLQLVSQLSLGDWLVLVEAWWALLGFFLALRWLNFDRLEAFTRPAAGKVPSSSEALQWAHNRQKVVSLAGRLHLLSMTCLPRAITLRWMLSRHAIPAELRIGVNKASTRMVAHAWVEVEGEAIGEPEDITERFSLMLS
jgi:hypothetical protein